MQHTVGLQLTIPQLKWQLAQTRIAVGALGETLVARALEKSGYQVSTAHERGDLTVADSNGELLYVEVKTSRRGRDGVYRFTFWKHWQGRQRTDHRKADFVVLLCIYKTGDVTPFVIPVSDVGNRHSAAIYSYPTRYKGWLSPFRQNINEMRLPL